MRISLCGDLEYLITCPKTKIKTVKLWTLVSVYADIGRMVLNDYLRE
jgi:hypothetical protein